MKIEVDLKEIFEDEDGNCISMSLKERIEQSIIQRACQATEKLVTDTFNKEISQQIPIVVKETLDKLIVDLLDREFQPVDKWGSKECYTTIRGMICKDIESQLVWKDSSSYSSDQSAYTRTIKDVVASHLKEFAKQFSTTVDEKLVAECMQHAINKLRKTF